MLDEGDLHSIIETLRRQPVLPQPELIDLTLDFSNEVNLKSDWHYLELTAFTYKSRIFHESFAPHPCGATLHFYLVSCAGNWPASSAKRVSPTTGLVRARLAWRDSALN